MKKVDLFMVSAVVSFVFTGCGGGGSITTSNGTKALKGSVPGTLIEAFCEDGSYYKTTSIKNGTSKHPFSLNLPSNVNCKVVMTTNENDPDPKKRIITPIKFVSSNGVASNIKLLDDVDVGHIPLKTSGSGLQNPLDVDIKGKKAEVHELKNDPMDRDKNDIPDIYDDPDGDGLVNKFDSDDDGNGIDDDKEGKHKNDKDGDGIDDNRDRDKNNDGVKDDNRGDENAHSKKGDDRDKDGDKNSDTDRDRN